MELPLWRHVKILEVDFFIYFEFLQELATSKLQIFDYYIGRVIKMCSKFRNRWVEMGIEYREPINLMACPVHMEIGLCW